MAEEKKVKRSKQSKTVLFWDKSMGDLNLCHSLPLQKRVLLQVTFLRTIFFREAHANVGSTFQKFWQMKPKVKTTLSKMIQKRFHPSSATGTKFIENARKVDISACKEVPISFSRNFYNNKNKNSLWIKVEVNDTQSWLSKNIDDKSISIGAIIEDSKIVAEHVVLLHEPYFYKGPLTVDALRLYRGFWVDFIQITSNTEW